MASATKVRLRFFLAGTSRVIRPGFWMGRQDTNVAVPTSEHAALVAGVRAAVASSGLMAGFDDSVTFQEAEAQNFNRVQLPDRFDPKTGDPVNVFGWEASSTTTESSGADIPGTQTGDSLPPNCSWTFTMYSAVPGPAGRTRFFGPPLEEEEVGAGGVIDTTRRAQLEADMQAILGAAVGSVSVPYTITVASATRNDLSDVTATKVQDLIRSQRERM